MRLLTNIGLFLFAWILAFGLAGLAFLQTLVDQIRFGSKSRLADAFGQGAYGLDVYGNITYASFLNAWFLRRGGYHFGVPEETISSALGKNWTINRLTTMGQGCVGLLNLLDTDHCYKYIKGHWPADKPEPIAWWKTALFAALLSVTVGLIIFSIYWIAT